MGHCHAVVVVLYLLSCQTTVALAAVVASAPLPCTTFDPMVGPSEFVLSHLSFHLLLSLLLAFFIAP